MTMHIGSITGIARIDLVTHFDVLATFFVDYSGLPVKDRNWLLPIFYIGLSKEVTTFPKKLALWNLSMED